MSSRKILLCAVVLLCTSCITFESHEVHAAIPSYAIVPTTAGYIKFDSATGRTWALMGDHWLEFPNKVVNQKFELIEKEESKEQLPASKR